MKIGMPGIIAVAALGLAGCATGGSHIARSDPLPQDEIDQAKIVTVNSWASRRGYGVMWVHLPYKSRSLIAKDQ